MLSRLRSLFSRPADRAAASVTDPATLAPDQPLLVLGDMHGAHSALGGAMDRIEAHVAQSEFAKDLPLKLITVGDYIDRGPDSAGVLETLQRIQTETPESVICLMGNHERMMLDFIDDPVEKGGLWLRNGGMETLASFGVTQISEARDVEDLIDVCAALEAAMPEGLLAWLRGLPHFYQSGNVCVVHAALDPFLPVHNQSKDVMLWGHRDFLRHPREDALWVAHGHTIFEEAHCYNSRIAVDTGAYRTGHLSVAFIQKGRCDFI